jgi:hypothetical protein
VSNDVADPLANVPDGEGPIPAIECDGGYSATPVVTSSSIVLGMTVEQFTAMCDAQNGIVEVQPHCGGLNACRGFSYDDTTNVLSVHTCRASNSCSGWNCVICD